MMTKLVFNRESLTSLMKSHIVDVTFVKRDGTHRHMTCTLMSNFLPEPDPTYVPRVNDEVLPVWDIDMGEWRSFRLRSILEVDIR